MPPSVLLVANVASISPVALLVRVLPLWMVASSNSAQRRRIAAQSLRSTPCH